MSDYFCRLHRRAKDDYRWCSDCEMDNDPIVYPWRDGTWSLSRVDSASALLYDLGVVEVVVGLGAGGYGIDWGHAAVSYIDCTARQRADLRDDPTWPYKDNVAHVACTERGPMTARVDRLGCGAALITYNFGRMFAPSAVIEGARYMFFAADRREGRLFLRVAKDAPNDAPDFRIGAANTGEWIAAADFREAHGIVRRAPAFVRRKAASWASNTLDRILRRRPDGRKAAVLP